MSDWFYERHLICPYEKVNCNYAFAKQEIYKAFLAEESVWVKLNQLRQFLTLNEEDWTALTDFCNSLFD